MERDTKRRVALAFITALVSSWSIMLSGCALARDVKLNPSEARDALTRTIEDTAAQLDVPGWNRDHAPEVGDCGEQRANYTYGFGAPAPNSDHAADARIVADYWRSLGMEVRVVEDPLYVVYATGGPVEGLSFSTAPGDYYIAGESLCVPGDADEIRKQDNG